MLRWNVAADVWEIAKGNDAVGVNVMLIMYVKSLGPLNVYNNEKTP